METVFFAYSFGDADRVTEVLDSIGSSAEGWAVMSLTELNADWQAIAEAAIAECVLFVFVASRRSVGSTHCRLELNWASSLEKPSVKWSLEPLGSEPPPAEVLSLSPLGMPGEEYELDGPRLGALINDLIRRHAPST